MTIDEKLRNIPVSNDLFEELSQEDIIFEKIMGEISGKLIIERKRRNQTQEEFASLLCVKQSMVSKWENGDKNFTIKQIIKIFAKLNIGVHFLFCHNNEYQATRAKNYKIEVDNSKDSKNNKSNYSLNSQIQISIDKISKAGATDAA